MPPTALPTRMVEIASGIGHDCFWMMLFTTRQMANKLTRSKTSMASKRKSLKGSGVGVGIRGRIDGAFRGEVVARTALGDLFWSLEKSARMTDLILNDPRSLFKKISPRGKREKKKVIPNCGIFKIYQDQLSMGLWCKCPGVILVCLEVLWTEPAQKQCAINMLPCHVAMMPAMALQVSSILRTTSPAKYTQHARCRKSKCLTFAH